MYDALHGLPLGRLTFLRYSVSVSLTGVSGCMPRIFLRGLLWKVLTVFSLEVLILTPLLIFLLSKFVFSVLKASIATIFLRLTSFSVSSRLPSAFFPLLVTVMDRDGWSGKSLIINILLPFHICV